MATPKTKYKPLPKGITALPIPQPSDWSRHTELGERCCLFGWAGRAFGVDYFSTMTNPVTVTFCIGVAKEAGITIKPSEGKVRQVVRAFDMGRRTFPQWTAAWRRYIAKTYGLTRKCKVARPAPL